MMEAPTGHELLERLREGNRARVRRARAAREVAPSGCSPLAVVVACSDQAQLPEDVFDVRFGELVVAQVPGPFVQESAAATISFGVGLMGARLVIVLAHEGCGLLDEMPMARMEAPASGLERLAVQAIREARAKGEPVARRHAMEEARRVRLLGLARDVVVVPAVLQKSGAVEWVADPFDHGPPDRT